MVTSHKEHWEPQFSFLQGDSDITNYSTNCALGEHYYDVHSFIIRMCVKRISVDPEFVRPEGNWVSLNWALQLGFNYWG